MPDRPHAVLRVEPHQIPALRAAFADAADTIDRQLVNLRREAQIPEPWMGDPVSAKIVAVYHDQVMNGPDSTYAHLSLYRDELAKVADTLILMEAQYRRTEGENSEIWGARA